MRVLMTPTKLRSPVSKIPQPLREIFLWTPLAVLAGILAGSASALLLVSLDLATHLREAHPWLIALLPVAGLAVGCMYHYWGKAVEGGNNLILEEIHAEVDRPRATIPFRMTPFILIGTFLTHLFGGSAGREGTALQTGASLADQVGKVFQLNPTQRRILLMAGISAGFASVFGTPLAGFVFGLEVLSIGSVTYEAILPCRRRRVYRRSDLPCVACSSHRLHGRRHSVDVSSEASLRGSGRSRFWAGGDAFSAG